MYKVFVNDKPIIITSSSIKENNFPVYILGDIVMEELIYKLQNEKIKGISLYTNNLDTDWPLFLAKLNIVSAAGGLVINSKKEVLFINRNTKWDLPKGRIEKGETPEIAAIREVEEECGIFNLIIVKFHKVVPITTCLSYFQI